MLSLVWRASALDDLEQIIGYISERDLAAGSPLSLPLRGFPSPARGEGLGGWAMAVHYLSEK